jgi:hypothetical protein
VWIDFVTSVAADSPMRFVFLFLGGNVLSGSKLFSCVQTYKVKFLDEKGSDHFWVRTVEIVTTTFSNKYYIFK